MSKKSQKKPSTKNPLGQKASPEFIYNTFLTFHEGHLNPLKKGSVTVEAALLVPLFVIALMAIICLADGIKTRNSIQYDLYKCTYDYACFNNKLVSSTVMTKYRIPVRWDEENGVCCAWYYRKVPFFSGYKPVINQYIPMTFSDYSGVSMSPDDEDQQWGYITDSSTVFHLSRECTYLKPSVTEVNAAEIKDKRNRSGGKYYRCLYCIKKNSGLTGTLYITKYGSRYHCDIDCSRLMRDVHRVRRKDNENLPLCSKCGSRHTSDQ